MVERGGWAVAAVLLLGGCPGSGDAAEDVIVMGEEEVAKVQPIVVASETPQCDQDVNLHIELHDKEVRATPAEYCGGPYVPAGFAATALLGTRTCQKEAWDPFGYIIPCDPR